MPNPFTPLHDRWVVASARLRAAEREHLRQQLLWLREGAPPPTREQSEELARLRSEASACLLAALDQMRVTSQTLRWREVVQAATERQVEVDGAGAANQAHGVDRTGRAA